MTTRASIVFVVAATGLTLAACPQSVTCAPGTVRMGDICEFPPGHLVVMRSGAGSGTVVSAPQGIDCGATCAATYPHGTMVMLTPTPATGSVFNGWSGDCAVTGTTCTATLDVDRTVTADFGLSQVPLVVSSAGTGTGTITSSPAGIDCGTTCAASFDFGTAVTLTATPDATSVFAGWSGDCSGASTCTVTLDAARTVAATFRIPAEFDWVHAFGFEVRSVATDMSSNVIAAGNFNGTTDFGGGPETPVGGTDLFIAKYSPSGSHLWSQGIGGSGNDRAHSLAVDSTGDVFVAGSFQGTVDFGGGPLISNGGSDVFIATFSGRDGQHIWSTTFGGLMDDEAHAVSVTPTGEVCVAGIFRDQVDFGTGVFTANDIDVFVLKLAANGSPLWSHQFGGAWVQEAWGIATSGTGDVVVAGDFQQTVDFGGSPLTSDGFADAFLVRLSSAGAHLWSRRFGGPGTDRAMAVAIGPADEVAVTGDTEGPIDFGGGPLTSAGAADVFLAKLASDGSHIWSRLFGGSSADWSYGVAADDAGDLAITGQYERQVDFGGGALPNPTQAGIFVAKFSSGATHLWSRGFADGWQVGGWAAAFDIGGSVVAGGQFSGSADFGSGTPSISPVGLEGFLLHLGP